MHPPLEIHQHPTCKEYILALKQCHADNPVAKFWGVCNDAAKAVNVCFKGEKAAKRAVNKEKLRAEQERLARRFEARRQEKEAAAAAAGTPAAAGTKAAAAQGQPAPAAAAAAAAAPQEATRLPGYWIPEQRGIPKEQPQ